MRGGAANDFKGARFPQLAKSGEQIAFPLLDKETLSIGKQVEIKLGQLSQFGIIAIPFSFAFCQIDQKIEMTHVALAQ